MTARRADPLTGLPNRVLFMDRLERLIDRARDARQAPSFAVFFLDVDRFKIDQRQPRAIWPATSC